MQYKELYQELTQNFRYTDEVELVSVAELWKYRDFDRRREPKANQAESNEIIDQLKHVLTNHLLRNPLVIEYYTYEKRALLAEGNHRLVAAKELGMAFLPATVQRCSRKAPPKAKPVTGVEPDEYGYVRADLTPSGIGLLNCITRQGVLLPGVAPTTPAPVEPKTVGIDAVRKQLKDADFWNIYATITYPYRDFYSFFELVDYPAEDELLLANKPELVRVSKEEVAAFATSGLPYLDVDDMLPAAYRQYLGKLLGMPQASARELYEELVENSAYATAYQALNGALALGLKKCKLAFFKSDFFGSSLAAFYGRSVYLDYSNEGTKSSITMEIEIAELRRFKTVRSDDTSLHQILLRELQAGAHKISYSPTDFSIHDVDEDVLHAEVVKLIPASPAQRQQLDKLLDLLG